MTASNEHERTRERLALGKLLEAVRADPPPGLRVRTDAEMAASLEDTLRHHDAAEDLHVFGYGSLMWNPALEVVQTRVGQLHGWHRHFCLRTLIGRGSAAEPGAMLALDQGGSCEGLLFRVAAEKVRAELHLLWRREMLFWTYEARWVPVKAGGASVRALTFVANPRHERYIGDRPIEDIARLIRTGRGALGTSRSYFESTLSMLDTLGIRDVGMERLRLAILLADREEA
jgi:cation transport protein ChaC